MNQCPVCSADIQDSFGLIECPNCHKMLFADFDGALKVHEEADVAVPALETNSFSDDWSAQEEPVAPSLDSLDPVVEPESEMESEPEIAIEKIADPIVREIPSAIDEINAFANSEDASLKNGALLYNLTVNNIDTEDLKKEILDILKESKLNIDISKLKFALPTLEIKGLNPIKASVIVSKIKHLPVDVEWIQKSALTVVDGGSDAD